MTLARDHVRFGDDVLHLEVEDPQRLAFDLHDGPSQALLAIRLIVRDHLGRAEFDAPTRDLLARVVSLATEGKRQLDALAEGLLLEPVQDTSLTLALHDLAATVRADGGPDVDVELSGPVERLTPAVERALYRVAEGSVVNAWRHGGCGRVRVDLHFGPAAVVLKVTDDGRGVGPGGFREGRGLRGMRRRLQDVGGWLRVVGRTSAGLVVEAEVPRDRT